MGRVSKYKKVKSCYGGNNEPTSTSNFAVFGFSGAGDESRRRQMKLAKKARKAAKYKKHRTVVGGDDDGGDGKKRGEKKSKKRIKGGKGKELTLDHTFFDAPPVEKDDFTLDRLDVVKVQKRVVELEEEEDQENNAIGDNVVVSTTTNTIDNVMDDDEDDDCYDGSGGDTGRGGGGGGNRKLPFEPIQDDEELRVARLLHLSAKDGGRRGTMMPSIPTATTTTGGAFDATTAGTDGASCSGGDLMESNNSGGGHQQQSQQLQQGHQQQPPPKFRGRMEGESMRDFHRRINRETKMILEHGMNGDSDAVVVGPDGKVRGHGKASSLGLSSKRTSNPEKYQKKVDYLERKKNNKRGKKRGGGGGGSSSDNGRWQNDNDDDDGDDGVGFVTGEHAKRAASSAMTLDDATATALPSFLDPVERPPELKVRPRGAKQKTKTGKKHGTSLTSTTDEQRMEIERRNMERLRQDVQERYRRVKAQRRKVGDFHL